MVIKSQTLYRSIVLHIALLKLPRILRFALPHISILPQGPSNILHCKYLFIQRIRDEFTGKVVNKWVGVGRGRSDTKLEQVLHLFNRYVFCWLLEELVTEVEKVDK